MLYQTKFRNGNICGHSEKKNLFIILSTSYTCSINRSIWWEEDSCQCIYNKKIQAICFRTRNTEVVLLLGPTISSYNRISLFTTEDVIVRRNYILIKDELSVGWIHDFLLQHEVLSQRDLEDICSGLRPRHVQVDALLKLLLRHGRSACSKLIHILPDCGYSHILDVFHETTNFKTKEGNKYDNIPKCLIVSEIFRQSSYALYHYF